MSFFSRFILRFAGPILLVTLSMAVVGGRYSVSLFSNLKTGLEELLPEDARSVRDLDEIKARLETTNNIQMVVFSDHIEGSKKFVVDLATEIAKLPPELAAGVEYRIDQELNFFKSRRSLFIDKTDLIKIKDYIQNRIKYEIELYNPLTIIENRSFKEPKLDIEALKKKYDNKTDQYAKFPDGFYATADEKIRVLIVNLPGSASGIEGSKKLRTALDQIVSELKPTSYAPDLNVQYSGGVQDLIDEHEALIEDLALSTFIVCALVLMAMLIYFKSLLGTLSLVSGLLVGTLWTFGLAYFLVGYLNANSAFMGSIVIGNGINFGIILLARFMEERRLNKNSLRAIAKAIDKTTAATSVAALAAALAYGSLILTSFRGFRQFGVIGLSGMILCWIASYLVTPSMIVVIYRLGGLRGKINASKNRISTFIANLIHRFPKPILALSIAITLISGLSFSRLSDQIIETDLRKLRSRDSLLHGSMYYSQFVDQVFQKYLSPVVVLPKKQEDVAPIAAAIRKKRDEDGDQSFITNINTIEDFVPSLQNEKVSILKSIDHTLNRKILYQLRPEQSNIVQELLNPKGMVTFQQDELPELVLSKFREKDRTVGKLILIEPSLSTELGRSHHLIHFVKTIRDAADSISPDTAVAGTLPVTSDLFESIVKDGPRATLFALLAVLFLVIILFRHPSTIFLCSFALILGVLWLMGFVLVLNQKINFLNFIALPITFGIGVDYGVNIFQRYRQEKAGGILKVIKNTGGAVLLASFTTMTGYGSLLIASNQAFVSFGTLAIVGELTCLFAAIISLPAFICYFEDRKKTI